MIEKQNIMKEEYERELIYAELYNRDIKNKEKLE